MDSLMHFWEFLIIMVLLVIWMAWGYLDHAVTDLISEGMA